MCELNDRQREFADNYCCHFQGSKAYKEVYGCETASAWNGASRLLADDQVNKYISQKIKTLAEKNLLTIEYVITHLRMIVENEDTTNADKLRAIDMLCRYLGMFKEDITLHQEQQHNVLEIVYREPGDNYEELAEMKKKMEKERLLLEEGKEK
jgi:hypothetical protein